MTSPIFVNPVFKERVWGGTTLARWFPEQIPGGTIGECWAISGLPGSSGLVASGPGAGGTLEEAWQTGLVTGHPQVGDFPILAKILDPTDWLSVQVHPNDQEAQELEGMPRGKAECWYAVTAGAGAELILGHDLPDGASLRAALEAGDLDEHLIREPVSAGSFFMVPAGCVHAVGPDQLIYEVQQSSDITYRLYDFDRPGLDGRPRELHIDKGFSVVTPYDPAASKTAGAQRRINGGEVRTLVSNDHFQVDEYRVDGTVELGSDTYWLATVVSGEGTLGTTDPGAGPGHRITRGTSFVVPVGAARATVSGSLTLIVTTPAE